MQKVQIGDVVHVRGEVILGQDRDGDVRVKLRNTCGPWSGYVSGADIVHVEPRPFKVGDVVTWGGRAYKAEVRAIDQDAVLLRCDDIRCPPLLAKRLSDLESVS